MKQIAEYIVRVGAVGMACFHLYAAYFGTFHPYVQRSVPVLISLVIAFLTIRASKHISKEGPPPLYDWALALLSIPVIGYITINNDYLANRWPMTPSFAMSEMEIALAVLATLLILEATRRILGWPLVLVAILALAYTYWGEHIPIDALRHRVFSFEHMFDYLYMTDNGIWGVALGVAATYIILFIIFGAFAERAGVADFFIDLANSIAGHTRGGPAKVAIFSSGLIGSVTGSTVANVYTTGQFTIPMMKRVGYRPSVAGAVEALASNGGQIMPPILGATAFILAAYSSVPYIKVAIASLIPAALYFGGLVWFIHLEALKTGLKGIDKKREARVHEGHAQGRPPALAAPRPDRLSGLRVLAGARGLLRDPIHRRDLVVAEGNEARPAGDPPSPGERRQKLGADRPHLRSSRFHHWRIPDHRPRPQHQQCDHHPVW